MTDKRLEEARGLLSDCRETCAEGCCIPKTHGSLRYVLTLIDAPPLSLAQFTDEELEYIYLQCDCDADRKLFIEIERKIRMQIQKYRDCDRRYQEPQERMKNNE